MNTAANINQIITALEELEAKGCHSVFYEYGNGQFHIRIFKYDVKADNIVYEKTVGLPQEQVELDEITEQINNMRYMVKKTIFQCYKRDFIMGKRAGEWQKIKPCFAFGENATSSMLIDGTGYYINDPDNGLQYFVDMKEVSTTN
jgi:hypothetical protein